MAEIVAATIARMERSDALRTLVLSAFTVLLAVVFFALLIGDRVTAATF
jgi:hypothetical protein